MVRAGGLAAIRTCEAGSADVLRDVRHHLVQQSQAATAFHPPQLIAGSAWGGPVEYPIHAVAP
jgi:hypothetical protein